MSKALRLASCAHAPISSAETDTTLPRESWGHSVELWLLLTAPASRLPSRLEVMLKRGLRLGKAVGGEAEVSTGKSISLEDRHLAALTKQRQP